MPKIEIFFRIISSLLLLTIFTNCDPKIQTITPVDVDPESYQVTAWPWPCSEPAWSADGKSLAFTRQFENSTLAYFDLTGTKKGDYAQLKADRVAHRISLSPDGQKFVYRSAIHGQLWIYSTLDDSQTLLTPDDSIAVEASWSPDGRQIAYISGHKLNVISADGGTPKPIYFNGRAQIGWPTWSPDSKIVAFHCLLPRSVSQIFTISVEDSEFVQVTNFDIQCIRPDWSADGQKIAFSSAWNYATVWSISPAGDELNLILPNRIVKEYLDSQSIYPCWSPDGNYIAVGSSSKMLVYNLGSDQFYSVSDHTLSSPQWLPDGQSLIARQTSSEILSEICTIKLENLHENILTSPFYPRTDRFPNWTDNQILFVRQGEGLLQVDCITRKVQKIISSSWCEFLKLSKDGSLAMYARSGNIFMVDLATKDTKPLIDLSNYHAKKLSFQYPDWSPDAQRFVCCDSDSLFIFKLKPDSLFTRFGYNVEREAAIPGEFSCPSWSVEHPVFGSRIAVSQKINSDENVIYMIDLQTLKSIPIIQDATGPCWAPDGCTLAYQGTDRQIYVKQVLFDLSGN